MGFARVLAVECVEGDLVFQLLSTQDVMGWNLFHAVSFAGRVKEYGCLEMISCYRGCDWVMTIPSQQEGGWVCSPLVLVSGGHVLERESESEHMHPAGFLVWAMKTSNRDWGSSGMGDPPRICWKWPSAYCPGRVHLGLSTCSDFKLLLPPALSPSLSLSQFQEPSSHPFSF